MKFSLILEDPSIKRLLQQQFFKAYLSLKSIHRVEISKIPLYRLQHQSLHSAATESLFIYRCSLPLQLASHLQLSPTTIASQLISHLSASSLLGDESLHSAKPQSLHSAGPQPSLTFRLEIAKNGVIDCCLEDSAVGVWLNHLPYMFLSSFTADLTATDNPSLNLFPIQYTHARCCSLLRLGHFDGLIEFNLSQLDHPTTWSWIAPNPIPWHLLREITEYALIAQFFNLLDKEINPSNYITLTTILCQAFWELEQRCRIWGEIKQKNRELAQARLGLVAMTQFFLRWLLQEQFNVTACVEM